MLLKHYLSVICIGLACLTQPVGLVLSAPSDNRLALTPPEIQAQMAQFVVKIDGVGEGNNGSGFIVKKNGNRYTVLTNEHVVRNSTRQTITTPDGKNYSFSAENIRTLPGIDLAEITFVSEEIYNIAKLSTSSMGLGDPVYVYGWNAVRKPIYPVRQARFSTGNINQNLPIDNSYRGYTLVFSLPAVRGLSGSPLLNESGEVIGIYGLTDLGNNSSTLGISIATYQRYAGTARVTSVALPPKNRVTKPPENIQTRRTGSPSGQLEFWKFDPSQNRLYFKTTAGVQPKAVLLYNPTRLVIDLPGIGFSRPVIIERLTGNYRSLRVGQFDNTTTRLVLELRDGMTFNPKRVQFTGTNPIDWYVSLPDPETLQIGG
jgi:Trypsin-like peptidase domain/AMIN domain